MNDRPDILTSFRTDLERAIGEYGARRRARRRSILVGAPLVAVAAAAVALTIGSRHAPLSVQSASASTVVRRALHALTSASSDDVFHIKVAIRQYDAGHPDLTWQAESWEIASPTFVRRSLNTDASGTTEAGSEQGNEEIFDPGRNTIYLSPDQQTQPPTPTKKIAFTVTPGPRAGSYTLHVRLKRVDRWTRVSRHTLVVSAADLQHLRSGKAALVWMLGVHRGANRAFSAIPGLVDPAPTGHKDPASSPPPSPFDSDFTAQILQSLRAGDVQIRGHETVDGIDTLKLDIGDGSFYFVDSRTYAPVEATSHGTTGGTVDRFLAYEFLPPTPANRALASLKAQHPDATVNTDPTAYDEAQQRIFPHG